MHRKGFQLFFEKGGAAGSGAGAAKADEKAAPSGGSEKGAASAIQDEGANKASADKVIADKAAADKVVADAAAKEIADKKAADDAEALKNETPEAKATREKAEADALEAKKNGPPEKYELKVGKDAETFIDANDLKVIEKFARDKGLNNDQAQALVNDRAGALLEQSVAFRAITEADPNYGGDKLPETERLAKLALDKLRPAGTPRGDSFRQILAKTGYGNNLEIVSLLADLGKQLAEDTQGERGNAGGGGDKKGAAETLYDHPSSKLSA